MHVVKAYAQEKFQTEEFVALNEDYQQKSMEMARLRGIITPVMQGINGLTILIVIWYGGIRVARGDLLVADIVAFIAYLNVLAWPTAAFGWMFSLVERGRAAMKRLEELFKIEPAIADGESTQPVHGLKQGYRISRCLVRLRAAEKRPRRPLTASVFPSPSDAVWGWLGASGRVRARWRSWCRACSTSAAEKFFWTARISASSLCAICAKRSATCPRTRFSFPRRSGATSPSAATT